MTKPILPILLSVGLIAADTVLDVVVETTASGTLWHPSRHPVPDCGHRHTDPAQMAAGEIHARVTTTPGADWAPCAGDPLTLRNGDLTSLTLDERFVLEAVVEQIWVNRASVSWAVARHRIRAVDLLLADVRPALGELARTESDRAQHQAEQLAGTADYRRDLAGYYLDLLSTVEVDPDFDHLPLRAQVHRAATAPAAATLRDRLAAAVAAGRWLRSAEPFDIGADDPLLETVWQAAVDDQVWLQLGRGRRAEDTCLRYATDFDPHRHDVVRLPTVLAAGVDDRVRYLAPGHIPRAEVLTALDLAGNRTDDLTEILVALAATTT